MPAGSPARVRPAQVRGIGMLCAVEIWGLERNSVEVLAYKGSHSSEGVGERWQVRETYMDRRLSTAHPLRASGQGS